MVMTADRIYYIPYELVSAQQIVSLHCRMNSAVGAQFRMGIYRMGSDGDPQELIYETADLIPAANGFNETFTAIDLPAGHYFTSIASDAADTVYCYAGIASYISGSLGSQNSTALGTYPCNLAYEASASWATLPATAAPTTRTADKAPRILMGI